MAPVLRSTADNDDTTQAAALAGSACRLGETYGERFTIVRELATGGMAHVYLADDTHTRQRVAFKVLRAAYRQQPVITERLRLEGELLCRFPSPHIPRGHAQGVDPRCGPYLAMELLEGKTLRDLNGARSLSPARAIGFVADIAEAMDSIHAAGIVHRDLKPDNLFIARSGSALTVKILDWGLSRMRGALVTPKTRDHVAIGTMRYMSPEQIRGQEAGPRSDIYSLCVVLYELLAGRFPYGDDGAEPMPNRQLAGLHISGKLVPLPSVRTDIPGLVWDAIGKGLARAVDQRHASMRHLASALRFAATHVDDTREMHVVELKALLADMAQPSTRDPGSEVVTLYGLGIDPRDLVDDDPPPGSTTFEMPALVRADLDATDGSSPALRPVARLDVIEGPGLTRSFDVGAGSHVVGRDPWAQVWIDEPAMSARHAIVSSDGNGKVSITDLGGRNGTTVNGAAVRAGEPVELRSGDRIEMGRVILALRFA